MIDQSQLQALPDNALVVNIARGRVVNEQALYHELKSGRIRAGIDVWYLYPQDESEWKDTAPSECPYHELDNVVMTPHLAGHNLQTEANRVRHLADLLNAAARGEPLPNRIDPERGY